MRYLKILIFAFIATSITACFKVKNYNSDSKPVNHALFDSLLRQYVNKEGFVNYEGFIRDSVAFNKYLDLLSRNHPNEKNWARNEQMAYWINAYNAFTIKLICNYYPVKSIKDIKKGIPFVSDTWAINFIKIEGKTYNLNNIEHGILRPKYDDPRIHFAVNCASTSCPKLLNEAFIAEKLDAQLETAAKDFINDGIRNKISSSKKGDMSKIFSWFAGDFRKTAPSVIAFINRYADIKLDANANLDYLDYDWNLNKQ
jgi:Protein of unknown function, DUF547